MEVAVFGELGIEGGIQRTLVEVGEYRLRRLVYGVQERSYLKTPVFR